MTALAESDSDDSDRRPARRRRVEAAQADDMDEDEVSKTAFTLCSVSSLKGVLHKNKGLLQPLRHAEGSRWSGHDF